jgi:hypothetical protein
MKSNLLWDQLFQKGMLQEALKKRRLLSSPAFYRPNMGRNPRSMLQAICANYVYFFYKSSMVSVADICAFVGDIQHRSMKNAAILCASG